MFDGQTFFGWRPQVAANFEIENGQIVVDSGKQCLLCTTTQFSDYILKVDFKCDPQTNSGIFLRTSPTPKNVKRDCFELNIAPPDNPYPTGSFVGRKKYADHQPNGEWHTYEVTMEGNRATVLLDGNLVMEYTDPEATGRGFIGLQHNSGQVAFRNIKLKPLKTTALFNGKNLDGWKTYPNMASEYTVTVEGNLEVRNGRGQIETVDKFGNFVLQLDAISHGVHLNSGVFFRCIPGEEMNGYESQVHSGFQDNDRTQPLDAGSGGIFRRKNARWVASNDFEWFTKTIVADGPHIAVWVNGYMVNDWVDTRKPNPNPRRGYRAEPGTIMLQGHDPTTRFSFRNIRIAEIRPR